VAGQGEFVQTVKMAPSGEQWQRMTPKATLQTSALPIADEINERARSDVIWYLVGTAK
jgi:hypothetical protein